jgi:hypothetical protein
MTDRAMIDLHRRSLAYLDEEMTYQARRRWSRDPKAAIQGDPSTEPASHR